MKRNLSDLYRIYCAAFVKVRLGQIQFKESDPAGIIAEETTEGMFALALGVEDGSRGLRTEAKFREAMRDALLPLSEDGASPSEEDQIRDAVSSVLLGSWTTASELIGKVSKLLLPTTVDRHRALLWKLCDQRAKEHNDSLEKR